MSDCILLQHILLSMVTPPPPPPSYISSLSVYWVLLVVLLYGWCHMKYCCLGLSSVYTIQQCTSLQCHFIQSHIGRVYVCLSVTCHLHFWQNDWDLLRTTAVTEGWNGYWNTSQHRKLTLEKKILLPLLPGLKPGTLWSRGRRSNNWVIPAPQGAPFLTAANPELKRDYEYTKLRSIQLEWGGGSYQHLYMLHVSEQLQH